MEGGTLARDQIPLLPSPPPSHRHYKGFSRPDSAQSHITHNHTQWFPCSPGTHSLNVSSPLVHSVSLDNKTLERISVPTLPTVLEKHSHSHKKSNNCSPRKLLTLPNSKLWLLGTLYLCLPDATQFLPRPMVRSWILSILAELGPVRSIVVRSEVVRAWSSPVTSPPVSQPTETHGEEECPQLVLLMI